jgi:hypothetical protein
MEEKGGEAGYDKKRRKEKNRGQREGRGQY